MPAPSPTPPASSPNPSVRKISRRKWLMPVGIALNAVAGALIALPVVGYLLAPASRKQRREDLDWVSLGDLTQFPVGETRLATYRNPFVRPWDGDTGDIACWVRRIAADKLQVFAINCAHLGCPVRWFAQSGLFMCPCHGGVYYQDGSRASGPPERGLFEYTNKVVDGKLMIEAGQLPTLSTTASLRGAKRSGGCQG